MARPDEVLRRPAGSREALARLKLAKAPPKPKGPSKAALKKPADLEKQLADLDAAHASAAAKLARKRAELEGRSQALEADHAARREKLEAALTSARRALG
jgi:hypothetical protein